MAEKTADGRGRPKIHEDDRDRRKSYRENQKSRGMISFSTYVDKLTKDKLARLCEQSGRKQSEVFASLTEFATQRLDEFLHFVAEDES